MIEVLKELSDVQLSFICSEFSISREMFLQMGEEQLDQVYDLLCNIEVDETLSAGDGELSERGKVAEGIVTIFGDRIAQESGFLLEDDD